MKPLELSQNALTVLERRYLKRDEADVVESPEELFRRVARIVASPEKSHGATAAQIESLASDFYDLMATRQFMPNSPTLMNAGRPLGQLSACFVLPVEDALSNGRDGIYDTLRNMALVHQSGGGTGFSFSRLRPKNDVVRSTMGVASGPVSFMSLYDASTEVVKQGGTRRGANMGILRVDHPDILEFIHCKDDTSRCTNFNISVAITDAFMQAVHDDTDYGLVHPRSGEEVGRLQARQVFDQIVDGAWKTGEPGVFFIDRANHWNPVPALGQYEATNPCGEQPLLPYDVCNLGSINLGVFVNRQEIDWEGLRLAVHLSTRFLDNVIDANRYTLPEIHDLAHKIRRIGLGIMGWADMLVRLRIPYDSEQACDLASKVMQFVDEEAKRESERLAESRGVFPAWEESIWGPDATCARDRDGQRIRPQRRLRHCNLTTVAPTGTISILAGCSSGIEPLFAVAFLRNQAGALMPDVNGDFLRIGGDEGWASESLMQRIAEAGHIHFDEVPEEWQRVFKTAHDVTPEWHVRMQAAFQRHTDSAISKTCNFPRHATEEDVRRIYEMAFEVGLKGVTVYRDGSRDQQVLSTGSTARAEPGAPTSQRLLEEQQELKQLVKELEAELARLQKELLEVESKHLAPRTKRTRPDLLKGSTRRVETPLGTLYVTITEDDRGQPFEVFMSLGKAGGALMADVEAIGRLISLALRSGIPFEEIHRQLRGISSDRVSGLGPNKVLSVPDAIGIAIERWAADKISGTSREARAADGTISPQGLSLSLSSALEVEQHAGVCPDCSSQLEYAEGCMKCHVCGYSECG